MERRPSEELIPELFETILKLRTREDCAAFFADLCTEKEVRNMAERWAAARLLLEGKTYLQVIESVDISSATLSRVSRCVRHGTGYTRMLDP
ncbi:MAG: TrpR-related protein YerC/YecD [Clostridia bacterium]|nr:TrpR-related protein YerC/YecD [Clostridia bacterium]